VPNVKRVTTESHLIAAGGAVKAARLVMEKRVDKAFALVRPPGHHAMKVVQGARGFCNINIEAVMIEYLREHYGPLRIAVVDTDCHHGDGTQDIYWHDPDVLYISMHQDGRTMYPGSGFPLELGGPQALGKNINIPLPPHTSDEGFLQILDEVVLPVLDDFQPDLIINSAGQDNHFTDPITQMNFSAQGYARLNERLNPDIAVLEGGYSIQGGLPYVNLGIALAMAGLDYSRVVEPHYNAKGLKQQDRITDYLKRLGPEMVKLYRDPPRDKMEGREMDGWFVREKNIYYDTDRIHEKQTESVRLCDDCPGVVLYDTSTKAHPRSLGVQIPANACRACAGEGMGRYHEALVSGMYQTVHLINRRDRIYREDRV
jgi:acetoin utilization deacetylase AcuC-like enzyme